LLINKTPLDSRTIPGRAAFFWGTVAVQSSLHLGGEANADPASRLKSYVSGRSGPAKSGFGVTRPVPVRKP